MSRFDNFIVLSSGDPEEHRYFERKFRQHEANEAEGLCPNGCAPIIWDDPQNRRCPVCGFHGWTNVPHPEKVEASHDRPR